MSVLSHVSLSSCIAALIGAGIAIGAAEGPGIVQPTFTAAQVGTEVAVLARTQTGNQPTFIDFQHGWLMLFNGPDKTNEPSPSWVSWWNLADPTRPVRSVQVQTSGNKPHMAGFWGTLMTTGHQDNRTQVWDAVSRAKIGTASTGVVGPVWYTTQAPYLMKTANGYGTRPNQLEILNARNPSQISTVAVHDLASITGFYVGATHAVGNLLICSAGQAAGAAVIDISDLLAPKLLSKNTTGKSVYTSMVYGSRLYVCETSNGIRVFDFSDPKSITPIAFIDLPDNPRYVLLKEGKGYSAPGAAKIVVFDTGSNLIERTIALGGGADFVYPLGNVLITGGNSGRNRVAVVANQAAPDTQGPSVTYISPTNGATAQALTSRIGLIMSDQIDVRSLTAASFKVAPLGGAALAGTWSTQTGIINFVPDAPLAADTTYEIVLPAGGVKDVVGNGLRTPFSARFSTGSSIAAPVPSGLAANATGHDRIQLAWQDVAGETGFRVERAVGSGSFAHLTETAANSTSFLDTSVAASTTYRYRVRSLVGNTASAPSAEATATTPAAPSLPAAPTGLSATALNTSRIDLAWTDVAANETGYRVERSTAGSSFAEIAQLGANVTAFSNVGLNPGTSYAFRVRAVNQNGFSGYAGPVSATTASGELHAHWPLDGSTADISGNGRALLLAGAPSFGAGRVGQGLQLDGKDDSAVAPAFTIGQQFSLVLWAKVTTAAASIQTLAANTSGGFATNGFRFFINSWQTGDRKLIFETGNGSAGDSVVSAPGAVPLQRWNHLAVTVDRATGLAQLYVNAVPVEIEQTVRKDFGNTAAITLARMGNSNRLQGGLDGVRIFARRLTPSEISALYQADGGNQAPVVTAMLAAPTSSQVGVSIAATAMASDSDGDPLTWRFDFGDGTIRSQASGAISHAYVAPGRHLLRAEVSDGVATVAAGQRLVVVHHPLTSQTPQQSSTVLHDPSRDRVWAVSPDDDAVTIFSASSLQRIRVIATADRPSSVALSHDAARVWVTCAGAGLVKIYSAATGDEVATVAFHSASEPMGIVCAPAGDAVYVALMGRAAVVRVDPITLAFTRLALPSNDMPGPRALALSGDGTRLWATRFVSPDGAGEVWELATSSWTLARTLALAVDAGPDTTSTGRGLPNYLTQVALSPDGRRLWVTSKKDNIARGTLRDNQDLTFENTVRSLSTEFDAVSNAETRRFDHDNRSLPAAVRFSPMGDIAWTAFILNEEVAAIDTATGNRIAAFTVPHAPDGLALSPDGKRLFVHRFLGPAVSAYDVSGIVAGTSSAPSAMVQGASVTTSAIAGPVLAGKRIFYNAADSRMALDGYLSCASCHLDGGHDGRTWDFTGRGEGLRNTATLRGRSGMGHGRVHWSANFDEIQDFEHDIRSGFGGAGFLSNSQFNTGTRNQPLGAAKAGVSADLDALAAYVSSLTTVGRSPYRNTDGSLTADAVAGKALFAELACASCHSGSGFTDSSAPNQPLNLHDVGTLRASSGKRLGQPLTGIDTPTLRGLWETAPFLHDGSTVSIEAVIQGAGPKHGDMRALNATEQRHLAAYLRQIDDTEPAPVAPAPQGAQ